MENLTERIMEWGALYGARILGALAIIIIGRLVVGILTKVIRKLLQKGHAEETLTRFLVNLTRIGLLTFVIIAALGSLGVQTASFIAVIGAAGLAVGFALQGSLANFASGVLLVVFRPFKVGDYVEAGGTNGSVEEVRIFNTVLKTPDNKMVIVPNSKITGDNIVNYSAKEMRRIDLVFGIGYGDDLLKAKKVLQETLAADQRILRDPAPVVAVLELGDSSVNLAARPWVKTEDYWNVYFDLTERVKLKFDEMDISIPFPQRDVHLYQSATG
ncbi:MAG: mechanosensitive ion channel [candidate division Zixibacteria bacterium]|nr:mechanosensitive ion channel [candidate division Zixibacteria bacterium]